MTEPLRLIVWAEPKNIEGDAARERADEWFGGGGYPARSPFEPSADVAWLYRELANEFPEVPASTDAEQRPQGRLPPWLAGAVEEDGLPPALMVGIRLVNERRKRIRSGRAQ